MSTGTSATVWDIYDSFCNLCEKPASVNGNYPQSTTVTISKGQEKRGEKSSSYGSSISNGNSTGGKNELNKQESVFKSFLTFSCITSSGSIVSSVLETDILGNNTNNEPDPQQILLSESFQYSLLIMERNIVANIFQPKLAAYRQLPILEGKHANNNLHFIAEVTPAHRFKCQASPKTTHLAGYKMYSSVL